MDRNRHLHELVSSAMDGKLSRRDVLRRALVLGLSAPAIGALLAACGGDDDDDDSGDETATEAGGAATTEEATEEMTEEATEEMTGTEAATGTEEMGTSEGTEEETGTAGETETAEGTATGTEAEGTETEEAEGTGTESGTSASVDNPPEVANADEASQYSGTKIVYYGDPVGIAAQIDASLSSKFTEATGIEVEVVPRPEGSDETLATYLRLFQAESGDMDVLMIDVVWPGSLAPHLLDLSDAFSDTIDQYYEGIVTNNTVDGKLVGIPWFGDFGMLYYRTDLLEEYGFSEPPATWQELQDMATTIIEGESADNPNFTGFVFQGNAYEGLTCDGLEWLASTGGGTIVDPDGTVTLNNDAAIQTLAMAQGWVGTISPQGVTTYQEDESLQTFLGGNSAFMRNWPYAYSISNGTDSAIAGKFDVAPLPAAEGEDHVGTVGGWQIAVSSYSKNPEAAIEYAKYITSAEVIKWRALVGSFVPTMASVAEDPEVAEAMPFLANLADVVRVTRPAGPAGDLYNEVSSAFFQGVNGILTGDSPEDEVPDIADEIEDVLG